MMGCSRLYRSQQLDVFLSRDEGAKAFSCSWLPWDTENIFYSWEYHYFHHIDFPNYSRPFRVFSTLLHSYGTWGGVGDASRSSYRSAPRPCTKYPPLLMVRKATLIPQYAKFFVFLNYIYILFFVDYSVFSFWKCFLVNPPYIVKEHHVDATRLMMHALRSSGKIIRTRQTSDIQKYFHFSSPIVWQIARFDP